MFVFCLFVRLYVSKAKHTPHCNELQRFYTLNNLWKSRQSLSGTFSAVLRKWMGLFSNFMACVPFLCGNLWLSHSHSRESESECTHCRCGEKFNIKSLKIEAFFMSMDLYFIAKKLISTSNLLSQYNSWVIAYTLAPKKAIAPGNMWMQHTKHNSANGFNIIH